MNSVSVFALAGTWEDTFIHSACRGQRPDLTTINCLTVNGVRTIPPILPTAQCVVCGQPPAQPVRWGGCSDNEVKSQ